MGLCILLFCEHFFEVFNSMSLYIIGCLYKQRWQSVGIIAMFQTYLLGWLKVCSLRSGGVEYVISLITFYDTTFWWWSYTHNSDQNLCWTWFFLNKCWICLVMEWSFPAYYVGCITKLALTGLHDALPNTMGTSLTIP
jgi:hypothetical protein